MHDAGAGDRDERRNVYRAAMEDQRRRRLDIFTAAAAGLGITVDRLADLPDPDLVRACNPAARCSDAKLLRQRLRETVDAKAR